MAESKKRLRTSLDLIKTIAFFPSVWSSNDGIIFNIFFRVNYFERIPFGFLFSRMNEQLCLHSRQFESFHSWTIHSKERERKRWSQQLEIFLMKKIFCHNIPTDGRCYGRHFCLFRDISLFFCIRNRSIYRSINMQRKFFPSVTSHIGHWLTTVDDGHNAWLISMRLRFIT